MKLSIAVIIPALNEEKSIAQVLQEIPKDVREVIVVDNGSTDQTTEVAQNHGATVLQEPQKGYGYACLKGLAYLEENPPEVVVFLDGDYSDYPEDLPSLVAPIASGEANFVVGARRASHRAAGSLTPQQIFGNALACWLMKHLYGGRFTDLGPFRAIRWDSLQFLKMEDKTYGWTVEMQLKILRYKIPYQEVPVRYRQRIGVSKVSGTLKGSIFAGVKILGWVFKYYFKDK